MSSSSSRGNETVHISLGESANLVTSHLLNLQGLACTSRDGGGEGGVGLGGDSPSPSSSGLCDPSVTHDTASSAGEHYYVPRALIVDGRDSFGPPWGGVDRRRWGGTATAGVGGAGGDAAHGWDGPTETHLRSATEGVRFRTDDDGGGGRESMDAFRMAATAAGLSTAHSRFSAPPPPTSSHGAGRHVNWDDLDDEDEDEEDMNDAERERRRRKLETEGDESRREWGERTERAWEDIYRGDRRGEGGGSGAVGESDGGDQNPVAVATTEVSTHDGGGGEDLRTIRWHDYWMPPRPTLERYAVPLPFDTGGEGGGVTSFRRGYRPEASAGAFGGGGEDGIDRPWREDVLSESLRRALEACDSVKGFNIVVDGGADAATSGRGSASFAPGGGFYAGLATSLLEEIRDECPSAGRFAMLVDPPSFADSTVGGGGGSENEKEESAAVAAPPGGGSDVAYETFRRNVGAGLALHGLSSNADAFLPLSLDGARRAIMGGTGGGGGFSSPLVAANRAAFEGSAALSLAIEAITLPYRLKKDVGGGGGGGPRRSRLGVQSGYCAGGYLGSSGGGDDDGPHVSADSLTYREFLACARPSSDSRRSILELDALLRPLDDALALRRYILAGTSVEKRRLEEERERNSRQWTSSRNRAARSAAASRGADSPGGWLDDARLGGALSSLSGGDRDAPFGRRSFHHHFALSAALRPSRGSGPNPASADPVAAYLGPMMESLGGNPSLRPEVSLGTVVRESPADLTGLGSYWPTVFGGGGGAPPPLPVTTAAAATAVPGVAAGAIAAAVADAAARNASAGSTAAASAPGGSSDRRTRPRLHSPLSAASRNAPVLAVLGNSTRSYPRLNAVSSGFVDALRSRGNGGRASRDVAAGFMPEADDCEDALEHCRSLADAYEPPRGSGLLDGEDDDADAYFDENDD